MKTSINKEEILKYVLKQIDNLFPDFVKYNTSNLFENIDVTFERLEYCFSKVNLKYFFNNGEVQFNHLHGDHYSMFLYLFSNTIYKNGGDINLCNKIFLLNKSLFGIDAFYEVELPKIFLFVHPMGTVLGRAKYSDYFLVYQNCNVGSNKDIYPVIGEYFSMHPGSAILGSCKVEDNCTLAAHSLLLDNNLTNNNLYIGKPKDYSIKKINTQKEFWL